MIDMVGLGIIGLVVQFVVLVSTVTWKLSRMETTLRECIAKNRREIDGEIATIRREILAEQSKHSREIGETFKAYREKISQIELFVRDTFVTQDTFDKVLGAIITDVRSLGDRLEARLMRMESKMDTREP